MKELILVQQQQWFVVCGCLWLFVEPLRLGHGHDMWLFKVQRTLMPHAEGLGPSSLVFSVGHTCCSLHIVKRRYDIPPRAFARRPVVHIIRTVPHRVKKWEGIIGKGVDLPTHMKILRDVHILMCSCWPPTKKLEARDVVLVVVLPAVPAELGSAAVVQCRLRLTRTARQADIWSTRITKEA